MLVQAVPMSPKSPESEEGLGDGDELVHLDGKEEQIIHAGHHQERGIPAHVTCFFSLTFHFSGMTCSHPHSQEQNTF